MPFEQHHESIDLSQERLGELEPVKKYQDVWRGKVDKAQEFCDKKAAEIEDDTVIDEGLAKIAVILENAAFEGAKENRSETILRNLMTGLERNIEKIESGVASEIEMQEMYEAARELLGQEPERPRQSELSDEFEIDFDMPQFEAERMYGFAETPSEHEFQQLVDSMETDEEKKAFLTSITSALSESNELGVEVTEKQTMRMEQLQLFAMMMQMFVTEFGDEAKFLGSQVRNKLDETMGIDTRGTAAQFKEFIGEEQLEKYQYEIMLNPNASLKQIIPAEAFMLIEMRTTLPRSQAQTEGLYTVAFRDPTNRTELHEKKQNILNWFRFYSHYGEVSSIIEEDLKAEITAAIDDIEATELLRIEKEVYEEIEEMKEENLAKWRSGYEGPDGEWVPAMTEQQIKYFVEGMEDESRAQKKKQYALKEKFDPDNLPSDKRDLWEIYNDTFDPKDQVTNLADSTWDTIRKELIINVPLIMASGGLASLARQAMSKAAIWTAGRMGLLTGLEIAYEGSRIVRAGAFVGLTLTEGAAFEAVHSMALKQLGFEEEWLAELNLPQAMQRIFWSTVTLGVFHGAGRIGQGLGESVDQATLNIFGEAVRKVTDSGTRRLLQEVLIAGDMEAFTMLLMGAVQTGLYEGSIEAFWEQMTSSDAIFHAYLAAYSLKAGHHAAQTFKPITGRGPVKRKVEQRDKPNPESAGPEARAGGAMKFVQGEIYLTSRGQAEIMAFDTATGEVKIRIGEGENARVETMHRNDLQRLIAEEFSAAMRPQDAYLRAEKIAVETGSEVQRISSDTFLDRAAEIFSPAEFAELKGIMRESTSGVRYRKTRVFLRKVKSAREAQGLDVAKFEQFASVVQQFITGQISSSAREAEVATGYDHAAEFKRIREMPNGPAKTEAIARAREKRDAQRVVLSEVPERIREFMREHPEAMHTEVWEHIFSREGTELLSKSQRIWAKEQALKYVRRHNAVREFARDYVGREKELAALVFGKEPSDFIGKVEVEIFEDNLFFNFRESEDFKEISGISSKEVGGMALHGEHIHVYDLQEAIIIGNDATGTTHDLVILHEARHKKNSVLLPESAGVRRSSSLKARSAAEKHDRQSLRSAQDEIVAYLRDGTLSKQSVVEFLTEKDHPSYDYHANLIEAAKNELTRAQESGDAEAISAAETELVNLEARREKHFEKVKRLVEIGFEVGKENVDLLAMTPFEHWGKLVESQAAPQGRRTGQEGLSEAIRSEQVAPERSLQETRMETSFEDGSASVEVGAILKELGFQELTGGQTSEVPMPPLDRAYIQADITNDVVSPRGAARQSEAFKRVAEIRDSLSPAEKALPRAKQNEIIAVRLRERAKVEGWNAGNVSANMESFLQANPNARYKEIIAACFPPELQAYLPRDLRFSIKQDLYVILNKREAIRKHTDGASPAEVAEKIFGFKPEGEVRMFRDAFTIFLDFANPVDYVRANNPNLTHSNDAALLQQQVNYSQHGRAFESCPNTKLSELDDIVTIGNNTIAKGKFEETLTHEREHQLHRIMRTLHARNKAFARMQVTQMPTSNALEVTDLFVESNRQALTQAQTEILAFLVGGKDSTSTIRDLVKLGGAYDFSRPVRERVINEYKQNGQTEFAEYVEIDIGGEAHKMYESQIVAYTKLAEFLLLNAKAVGGERAMATQLAATKIHNWPKVFAAEWAVVVNHSILPLARNNLLFGAERARQSGQPIDLKLLDKELSFYEATYGLKREQLIPDKALLDSITRDNVSQLLKRFPSTTNGDVLSTVGFLTTEKPACHLPPGVSKAEARAILVEAKKHQPDAEIIDDPRGGPGFLYSPSKIARRMEAESGVVEWLGIEGDTVSIVLSKIKESPAIEGFVLGFPESGLRTWERFNEVKTKMPIPGDLFIKPELSSSWEPADIAVLSNLQTRYGRVRGKTNIFAFVRIPAHRAALEGLYKKYFNATQKEVEFLFSLEVHNTGAMDYIDSNLPGEWWEVAQ